MTLPKVKGPPTGGSKGHELNHLVYRGKLFWSHKLKPVIHVVLKCVNNLRGLRGGLPNFEIPPNSSSSLAGGFLTEKKRKKC